MAKKQAFDTSTSELRERGAITGDLHADGCPTIDLSQDENCAPRTDYPTMVADTVKSYNAKHDGVTSAIDRSAGK